MLQSLISRGLSASERQLQLPGSMDYLRTVARTSRSAFLKFTLFLPLAAHRSRVSAEAISAARIAATLHQDCGTCVQIVLSQARQQGVSPTLLQSLLDRRLDDVPAPVSLAFRFGLAVSAQSSDAEVLRESVRDLFGEAGLVELALAIATAQLFPITKRALGYSSSCAVAPIGVRAEETGARMPDPDGGRSHP